mmetsp:Transcript_119215/g.384937  ORF Transcript_119215/g.384937 Transcript_119215/m.384937 type:complete len:429 (+) Transcript_119215:125-1411(+)
MRGRDGPGQDANGVGVGLPVPGGVAGARHLPADAEAPVALPGAALAGPRAAARGGADRAAGEGRGLGGRQVRHRALQPAAPRALPEPAPRAGLPSGHLRREPLHQGGEGGPLQGRRAHAAARQARHPPLRHALAEPRGGALHAAPGGAGRAVRGLHDLRAEVREQEVRALRPLPRREVQRREALGGARRAAAPRDDPEEEGGRAQAAAAEAPPAHRRHGQRRGRAPQREPADARVRRRRAGAAHRRAGEGRARRLQAGLRGQAEEHAGLRELPARRPAVEGPALRPPPADDGRRGADAPQPQGGLHPHRRPRAAAAPAGAHPLLPAGPRDHLRAALHHRLRRGPQPYLCVHRGLLRALLGAGRHGAVRGPRAPHRPGLHGRRALHRRGGLRGRAGLLVPLAEEGGHQRDPGRRGPRLQARRDGHCAAP